MALPSWWIITYAPHLWICGCYHDIDHYGLVRPDEPCMTGIWLAVRVLTRIISIPYHS